MALVGVPEMLSIIDILDYTRIDDCWRIGNVIFKNCDEFMNFIVR
jgi:hypothetical protein